MAAIFKIYDTYNDMLNRKIKGIKRYNQSTEPSLSDTEMCIWRDSDDGKIYLLYKDETSGQKKTEMT